MKHHYLRMCSNESLLHSPYDANSIGKDTKVCGIYTCNGSDKLMGHIFNCVFSFFQTLYMPKVKYPEFKKLTTSYYHLQISTNAPQIHHVMPMQHVTTPKDLTFVNATLDSVVMVLHVMVGFCLLICEVLITKSCQQS